MPKQIEKYGILWNTSSHAKIELACIKNSLENLSPTRQPDLPKYGEGLFHHVKEFQKIAFPNKYWHRWNEMLLRELCKPGRTGVFGPSSCVRGDTRIEDPITGERPTIEELYLNDKAPWVMTLQGPIRASVPFLKGRAELFEVKMKSGACFRATADHLVMASTGLFCRVIDLLHCGSKLAGFSVSHPQTISGTCLSTHVLDVHRFQKTTEDFQSCCYSGFRRDDVLPLEDQDSGQCFFPLQGDAPERKESTSFDGDGLGHKHKNNHPYQSDGRLSTCSSVQLCKPLEIPWSRHCGEEIQEHGGGSFRHAHQSQSGSTLQLPALEPDRDFDCRHYLGESYNEYSIHLDVVSSVTCIGTDFFFDLNVPVAHHYFAEGCIHHNSGKSMESSLFGLTLFYALPHGTTVIISSTTLDALKRRIWDYVVRNHREAKKLLPFLPGHFIESKQMLLADPKEEEGRSLKDGVIGVACRVGGAWKGMDSYVGTKNQVFVLVADEVTFMNSGFWDSVGNLESNDVCFAVAMGNLSDLHNPLAIACEPKMGWDSIIDTAKSRVYDTRWFNGRAVQFIGTDSPNYDHAEGHEPFKNLIGRRYIAQCAHNYGVESDRYNMFALGKIPRTSMTRTVFTRAQCLKWNAYDDVVWGHEPVVKGYMMDAAYSGVGGDRTPGAPFTFGKDVKGVWRFHAGPVTIYRGSESTKISHSEAIALQCRSICEDQDIPPEHVFYDGTGRSELTIAFARLWSAKVVPIEFGGPATERPGFTGNRHMEGEKIGEIKTCRESYDRFVTELWFAVGTCIVSDQMRGLDEDTVDEGCRRTWEEKSGGKQAIETKDDMRERTVRSPDLCDMVCCGLEGARRLGFPLGKTPQKAIKRNLWIDQMRENERKQSESENLITV